MKYYVQGVFPGEPWIALIAFSGNALKRVMHTYEEIPDLEAWESVMRDDGVRFTDEAGSPISSEVLLSKVDQSDELIIKHERQPVI